jgi:glycosyltransferase involved in cell wall biosynthesis
MSDGVSVIIPVHNEENSIRETAVEISMQLEKATSSFEIFIVDDGSNDRTAVELEKICSKNIKVITHMDNRGYGAALKSGIKNAQYECIVITDADGTYPNDRIPELVKTFQDGDYDMVVGARIANKVEIPLIRKPAKWFITKLASYLTGTKIPDLNSGLRVMRKGIVEKYIRILPDGFSFTSTITLVMLTNGYCAKYVPIDYFKREGKSKIRPIRDTLNFVQLIIRTVLYFNPLKIFIPLSLFLVLLAFTVLFGSWLLLGKAMDVSFAVILMTSVIIMAIGMLADLINKRIE